MRPSKHDFLLDPSFIYLNHGGFGAVPIPVFHAFQNWQLIAEHQPYEFFSRKFHDLLENARETLAKFLHADKDEIVFVNNTTVGLNTIIKSLQLGPNDEVLTTDHEYGALERTWMFYAQKYGYEIVRYEIHLPVNSVDELIEEIWSQVNNKTKVIYLSHIASPTGIIFPVTDLCKRARDHGVISIIDGAHAPGQIILDLEEIGADFYVADLHKWLYAPRSSAFLFARKEVQHLIEPLIISWGWQSENPGSSLFIDHHEWQGTQDISAFLSVSAALDFLLKHDWDETRKYCHSLASFTRNVIHKNTKLPAFYPDDEIFYAQMAGMPLPDQIDAQLLKNYLLKEYFIDIPVIPWGNSNLIRFSIQSYNDYNQIEILDKALHNFL